MAHSVRNPDPSRASVTCPEYPPSKYLPTVSAIRSLMRSRKASPTSRFFPDTRNDMASSEKFRRSIRAKYWQRRSQRDTVDESQFAGINSWQSIRNLSLLFAAPLHRRGNAHGLAVFRDRAPRDVDAGLAQLLDDGIVGQNDGRVFGVDQLLDAVPHRFGGMRLAAMRGRDCRCKEVFQLENTAAGCHVFVGGDARHRRFMHADGLGDGLEIERAQMLDAAGEKPILLANDLVRDLEDRARALVERAHQPGGALHAFGEIRFLGVA